MSKKHSLSFSTSTCSKSIDFQIFISPDVCKTCIKSRCDCVINKGTFLFNTCILLALNMPSVEEVILRLIILELIKITILDIIINSFNQTNDDNYHSNDNDYDWDNDSLQNLYQD